MAVRDFLEDTDGVYWDDFTLTPEAESVLDQEFFGAPASGVVARAWNGTQWVPGTLRVFVGGSWVEPVGATIY